MSEVIIKQNNSVVITKVVQEKITVREIPAPGPVGPVGPIGPQGYSVQNIDGGTASSSYGTLLALDGGQP